MFIYVGMLMVLYAGSSVQSPAQEENKQHNPLPVWGLGDEAAGQSPTTAATSEGMVQLLDYLLFQWLIVIIKITCCLIIIEYIVLIIIHDYHQILSSIVISVITIVLDI